MRLVRVSLVIALASLATACGLPDESDETLGQAEGAITLPLKYAVLAGSTPSNYCLNKIENWFTLALWTQSNNRIWLYDLEKDGMSSGVHWKLGDGSNAGLCLNSKGVLQYTYCEYPNLNEAKAIQFRAGRCNDSQKDCTKTENWTDWTGWTALCSI
jgi:hypothetical protein